MATLALRMPSHSFYPSQRHELYAEFSNQILGW